MFTGLWHSHMGWLFEGQRTSATRFAPDLKKDPVIRWVDKYFPLWALLGLAIPFVLGFALSGGSLFAGFTAFVWAGLVRVFLLHHATWSVNSICHMYGRQPFAIEDESRDNWLVAMVSLGEGWHHSHHAFPTSAQPRPEPLPARPVLPGHPQPRAARPGLERQAPEGRADRRQARRRRRAGRSASASWPDASRRGPVRSAAVATSFARPRLRGPELLRAVAEGTAGEVGDAFLRGLVRSVAEALAAKLVLVAEASDESGVHVKVVAGWYDGAPIEEPFEYDTAGQPCALVPGQTLVSFPEGLVEHFPEDRGAVEMGLESYLAVCLRGSDNTYLGHLAVLDAHRMEAEPEDVAVLKIFAARAGAELERRIQARALQASRARVIEAADAERRRVGRDLHDGAQQRLLAVSNLLKVARRKPEAAEKLLETAESELTAAHAELRELARGLHPVALSERGLPAAIESLCGASALAVDARRLPRRAAGRDRGRRVLRRRRVPDERVALRAGERASA